MIDEQTSKRITSLRYILATLVVFIHINIHDFLPENSTSQSVIYQFVFQLINGGIASCAVPLFFMFAAYLQVKKNDTYNTLIAKRIKSLVVPYCFWVGFYLLVFSVGKSLVAYKYPEILTNSNELYYSWSAKDWFHRIIGFSDESLGAPLVAVPFWFVRDLFIFITLSPIIIRAIKKCPFIMFMAVTLFSILGNCPFDHHLNKAIFYYVLGLYWGIYDINIFEKADKISYVEVSALFLFCVITTFCLPESNNLLHWLITASAVIIALKFSKLLLVPEKRYSNLQELSHYSFFVYAAHAPIIVMATQKVLVHLLPTNNSFQLLIIYFVGAIISISISTIIGILLRKYLPSFFAFINGGRK
ncbi:MAG: acyltransferase [Bacteroidales bacterium]|nr:acyltransferase [Bacteroidales bacterium]